MLCFVGVRFFVAVTPPTGLLCNCCFCKTRFVVLGVAVLPFRDMLREKSQCLHTVNYLGCTFGLHLVSYFQIHACYVDNFNNLFFNECSARMIKPDHIIFH